MEPCRPVYDFILFLYELCVFLHCLKLSYTCMYRFFTWFEGSFWTCCVTFIGFSGGRFAGPLAPGFGLLCKVDFPGLGPWRGPCLGGADGGMCSGAEAGPCAGGSAVNPQKVQ